MLEKPKGHHRFPLRGHRVDCLTLYLPCDQMLRTTWMLRMRVDSTAIILLCPLCKRARISSSLAGDTTLLTCIPAYVEAREEREEKGERFS